MGSNRSIGSLFIDIEARTAKMEQDMARVRSILEDTNKTVQSQADAWGKTTASIEGKIARFSVGLLGARTAVQLLAKEFRYVMENVEAIPGIPDNTVKSIQEMRHNLLEARADIRGLIAEAEDWFNVIAKGAGAAAGAFSVASSPKDLKAAIASVMEPETLSPTQIARDKKGEIVYDKELADAEKLLYQRTMDAQRAAMDEANQIIALNREKKRQIDISNDLSKDTLTQMDARVKAQQFELEANTKLESIQKRLAVAQDAVSRSLEKGAVATVSTREKISIYTDKISELRIALTSLQGALQVDPKNPVLLEQQLKLTEKLATAQVALNVARAKYGELGQQMGKATADDLEQAILKGESLHTLLGTLAGDLLKIILQREVFGPLADFLGGGFTSLFGMIPASASGGPYTSGPRLVGEFGPEIINPGGSGTIIPNDKLGSGSSGNNYYIDATGADPAAIMRLQQSLLALAGPGVVEQRAVSATLNATRRGGSLGRALSG